jgi:hypothetical protein
MDNVSPPAGFNPLTATDEQLKCYGFPQRPQSGSHALALWTKAMSGAKHWVPGRSAGEGHVPYTVYYGTWGGYVAQGANNSTTFKEVQGFWTQQATNATRDGHHIGDWVGLGGFTSASLIQAGTEVYQGSTATYKFWYMNPHSGCTPTTCIVHYQATPTITSGQDVYVDVSYDGTNAAYSMENLTLGTFHTYYQTTTYFSNSSAEAVVDDKDFNGGTIPAWQPGHYVPMNFQEEDAVNAANNWVGFESLVDDKLELADPNTQAVYYYACPMGALGAFKMQASSC